jgi:hypothetical protein
VCPPGTNATTDDILAFSGTVTLDLGVSGVSPYSVGFAAAYDVQTENFVLQAQLQSFTVVPGLLSITSPSLTVQYSKSGTNTISMGAVTFGTSGET